MWMSNHNSLVTCERWALAQERRDLTELLSHADVVTLVVVLMSLFLLYRASLSPKLPLGTARKAGVECLVVRTLGTDKTAGTGVLMLGSEDTGDS
jgi:hypothetical protein